MTKIDRLKAAFKRNADRIWYIIPFFWFTGLGMVLLGYLIKAESVTLIGILVAFLAYLVLGTVLRFQKSAAKHKNQKS